MDRIITTGSQMIRLVNSYLNKSIKLRKIPLVVVAGPTASGKTALGIALARYFGGEIISADSRQIYQGMAIGTAQPTQAEMKQAKHYLVDFVEPDQPFNLAEFQKLANEQIVKTASQKKLPLLVGGTGLYISTIVENYQLPSAKPNLQLRKKMEKLAEKEGKNAVHLLLQKADPLAAQRIHSNNLRYVIRALETASEKQAVKSPEDSPYLTLLLTVDWPRQVLYQRIEKRIDQQMEQGLLQETKKLLTKYGKNIPSISSLGYVELGEHLQGKISLADSLTWFKKNTRNFAKRQLTWFRKFPQVYSIPGEDLSQLIKELSKKHKQN